jgi:nicotinate phosphoribosyltransferase
MLIMDDGEALLLTDRYELTMLQAYHAEGMRERAVFSLFVRRLPEARNFLLACGLDTVLRFLERLHFAADDLDHLRRSGFDADFVDALAGLRFTGDVWAVPEGTPVFAGEPLLEVEAPLPEAQLVETFVLNQMHLQTLLASKAARVRAAAGARRVVDFGLRRMQGADAGLKSARAFHVAGIDATSNELAGKVYGVPVTGTMAHSYVQVHASEYEAFRAFSATFPEGILLVDTYDTLEGVRNVVRLAAELGTDFRVSGIRLDSGDLGSLAREARGILDAGGLENVRIFASGGLDEWKIRRLASEDAPIDGFGVGSSMAVSEDAPVLDVVYKLTEYAGRGRLKLSPDKDTFPFRKQVLRLEEDGVAARDVVARAGEELPGRALMVKVMERGRRSPAGTTDLDAARRLARDEIARLPARVRSLDPAEPPYPVAFSAELQRNHERIAAALGRGHDG